MARTDTVFDGLSVSVKRRRSIQLSSLPIQLILLKFQRQFDIRFFRNHGATWSNWNGWDD